MISGPAGIEGSAGGGRDSAELEQVTGRRSDQLNHVPNRGINDLQKPEKGPAFLTKSAKPVGSD